MMRTWKLHVRDFPYRRLPEPGELFERHKQFSFAHEQPEAVRRDVSDFAGEVPAQASGISLRCSSVRIYTSATCFGLRPEVCGQFDDRINPELCFAFGVLNMNVRAPLLAEKEVEPKPSNAQDRRTHQPQHSLRGPRGARAGRGKRAVPQMRWRS